MNIRVFCFPCQDTNMPESNFIKKYCNLSTKQINTISNIEWRTKLVDYKIIFYFFNSELIIQQELLNTIELTGCVLYVMWRFY